MVAASRVFYPESARRDVHILETRVMLLKKALREIEALNPAPEIAAIIEDAIQEDRKRKWR